MMFLRALVLACACAYVLALTPLAASGDDGCALYLAGPGRSSAFDYNLNLLRGNFGYEGQHTCITYEAVNQAYLEARKRIVVAQPKGDWKPEDYASVGEVILDVSINLAKMYGLTYEEVEKGLPLIDTSRTLIREVCPPIFSQVECRAGKYRRLDGLCNNLEHPTWGASMAPFQRLIGPLFSDGINAPRISHTGHDLPLSRVVSRTMHPDDGFHDHAGTIMVIAWGQFMDHDYTLTGTPLDPINRNDPEECCKRPPHLKHPYCNEIRIPDDDYFYRLWGVKCIDFVRAFPSPRPGCRLGSRIPYNTLTGSIDGNTVYGVTEKFARKLRTGYGGLLRMNPVFKEYGLKDLLPLKLDIPDEGCTRPNKNMYCFEAGEIRVNEQLILTVMHTLMAREHNRVAQGLAAVNPHWDDETIFQEARRINIAEIQHITYNEFLPILLGKDVMEKFGLVLEKNGYWDGYDTTVNPDVIASFASAAYRFGHSLLPTAVERWSKAHKFIASKRLSDLIRRPFDLYRAGVLDEYVMGLMNQVAQAMDDSITQEVTNHLFKKVGARFGMDLVSFNMQRGREFGIPGYMEFRKFCGLNGANSFQELFGSMPNETVRKYETIFEHPIDVDLWSGGVSERPLPGSMLGPTFACIIATQFSYSRRGDRFWYELPHQPSSFTPEQLVEVRKARLARVICDNTDIIDTVQLYPMVLPDHELNPRVPCRSGIIPSMDFSKWAEQPPAFPSAAKEFMTDANASNPNITTGFNDIFIDNDKNSTNITINNTSSDPTHLDCNHTVDMSHNQTQIIKNTTENIIETGGLNESKLNRSPTKFQKNKDFTDSKNNIEVNKPKSHFKNSLKRKRRSDYIRAPLIVNYETLHTPETNNDNLHSIYTPLPNSLAQQTKEKGVANFVIETLHDPSTSEEEAYKYKKRGENGASYIQDSSNNVRKENSNETRSSYIGYDENGKKITPNERLNNSYNNEEEPLVYNPIDELKFNLKEHDTDDVNSYPLKSYKGRIVVDSEETLDLNNSRSKSAESSENTSNSDEKLQNPDDRNGEIKDKIETTQNNDNNNNSNESKYNSNESIESSLEDNEDKPFPTVSENSANLILSTPATIQEVDLGDFSYERIRVKDNGEVETVKDNNESSETDSQLTNPNTKPQTHIENSPLKYFPEPNYKEEIGKQIKINVGEIKPVVEINGEDLSEEKGDKLNENFSFESIPFNTDTTHEKQVKNVKNNDNVKQQFERIPLDYKHEKKNQESEEQENPIAQSQTDELDENLNIKFGDISLDLPDIKLPDNILDVNNKRSDSDDNDDDNEKPINTAESHSNEEDVSNEGDDEQDDNVENGNNYDNYNKYSENYYNAKEDNSNEKKENDDDAEEEEEEEEDLYEKFVRERFGKQGSFKSRYEPDKQFERLRQKPINPELRDTLKQILNKTKTTSKQAEKSNDPNAGYMWTLEYGEQL